MRDVLPETGLLVHRLTLRVVDDGEGDFLHYGWQGPVCNYLSFSRRSSHPPFTFIQSSPASDPGLLAYQISVVLGNTDWDDVWLEGDWLVEPGKICPM